MRRTHTSNGYSQVDTHELRLRLDKVSGGATAVGSLNLLYLIVSTSDGVLNGSILSAAIKH